MKILQSLICFIIFSTFTIFAQQLEDVVYLKSGSIIHGTIIEQIPNVSVKVKTKDGNIFVYKIEEIEKMTREVAQFNSEEEERTDIMSKNKTSGFFFKVDASIGFPVGELAEGWDIVLGNNFHFGHIFSKNVIASGNVGWDMWMTSGSLGNGYEIYWGGSLYYGDFKSPFIYYARFGGGGQVNIPPVGDGEVGGNLIFGSGFGFKLSKSKPGAIVLEPTYHMVLNSVLPNSIRIGIGFMTTL